MKITFDSREPGKFSYELDVPDLYSIASKHKPAVLEVLYDKIKEQKIKDLRKKYGLESFDYMGFQLSLKGDRGFLIALSEHSHGSKVVKEEKIELDEDDSKYVFDLHSAYHSFKKFLEEE